MRWLLQPLVCLAMLANLGYGQDPAKPADSSNSSDADGASSTPAWLKNRKIGPVEFSGLFDGYYSFNDNHPDTGKNNLRNFDVGADRFDLNMAKVALEVQPGPVGFRVDAGFGRGFDVIHASSNSEPDPFRNILQAYVTFKPSELKGFEADFGKFLTSAGAELTETQLNWNYSRSYLFTNGPYFHFGLRTSMPIGKHFTGGVQVLQGWNNILDNNSGKTLGFTGNVTTSKVTWSNTYLVGPEKNGTTDGYRNFYDTVVSVTPGGKTSYYINFDYGVERNPGATNQKFLGIAGAGHYQATKRIAFSPRLEWYNDADGFITGRRQQLKEITLTAEYAWYQGILTRLEYRHDWSNQNYFDRGAQLAATNHQSTLAIGFLAFFGPKHQ